MCNNGTLTQAEANVRLVRQLAERKVAADDRVQALMLANGNTDIASRVILNERLIAARRERALIEAEIAQYVSHGKVAPNEA